MYRRNEWEERWSGRSSLGQRAIIGRRYWILDSRRRRRGKYLGTPRYEEYVVVLRVPGEPDIREKHKSDVPADVNFLQVSQSGDQLARSWHVFYLFPVWRQPTSPRNAAGGSSTEARWEPRPDITYCSLEPLDDITAFFLLLDTEKKISPWRDFSRSLTATHGYLEAIYEFSLRAKYSCRELICSLVNKAMKCYLVNNFIYVNLHSELFFAT